MASKHNGLQGGPFIEHTPLLSEHTPLLLRGLDHYLVEGSGPLSEHTPSVVEGSGPLSC